MYYIPFCSAGGILHYCISQEDLKVCGPDTWQTKTEVGDKITKILSSVSFVLSFEIKKKKKTFGLFELCILDLHHIQFSFSDLKMSAAEQL